MVENFRIHVGRRRVARLRSGTLIATTRAGLTAMLWERALATPAITVRLGTRVVDLDPTTRTLTLEGTDGGRSTLDASDARVVAADGVHSTARSALVQRGVLTPPRTLDWGVRFRVATSAPGASAPGMHPEDHHIFTSKGIYTATLRDGVWCVVMTAIEGDPSEQLVLTERSDAATLDALAAHLREHAPAAAPLLTREDLAAFTRQRSFGGAVVICPQLVVDDWLVLVGDAAHGVIPPTGEGGNAGLEDAAVLTEHLASGAARPLADYQAARVPDLHALGQYAWALCENLRGGDPARATATTVLRILDSTAAALHLPSAQVERRLFGPEAGRTPYREALGPWLRQRRRLLPPLEAGLRVAFRGAGRGGRR
ncbi:FAD-dependent monooxygenase [Brachybacterium sp. EF45031]|uniref:FAD-dependent oxidoreductase n=1 Tax=Brachybacterium sillae TaxID=2810536 RepID=UPI00217E09E2|nr:FAD-dependent monooxygenase [Brachybacterium sillae]MCS6711901.1 FAD-dependent monooxygenase [Brachybacterium sillae]